MEDKQPVADIIEIDDYRKIWVDVLVKSDCCGKVARVVYPVHLIELECSGCGKMSTFRALSSP